MEIKKEIESDIEERKNKPGAWKLVDFTPIRDVIDFGMNRVLVKNIIDAAVKINTREALEGRKPPRDWLQVLVIIMVAVIVGAIAFTIITQFMGTGELNQKLNAKSEQLGVCQGQLQACQTLSSESGTASPPPLVG